MSEYDIRVHSDGNSHHELDHIASISLRYTGVDDDVVGHGDSDGKCFHCLMFNAYGIGNLAPSLKCDLPT